MTKTEYERLQRSLNTKMQENLWVKYGRSGSWADGFRQGILVAKSLLNSEYERKKGGSND